MSYLIFARWFGLVSIILSLGILFNLDDAAIMSRNMTNNESGYIVGGILPIVFGSLTFIMQNNSSTPSWRFVITIIGLFMLVVGSFRVIFVKTWKKIMKENANKIPFLFSLFGLILSLLLFYIGFFAPIVAYH